MDCGYCIGQLRSISWVLKVVSSTTMGWHVHRVVCTFQSPVPNTHSIGYWLFDEDKEAYGSREGDGRHFILIPLAFLSLAAPPILHHPTSFMYLPDEFLTLGIKLFFFFFPVENGSFGILTKFYGVSGLKGVMICAT